MVRSLGERTAVIVGHDWGTTIAANSALARPDGLPRGRAAERALRPARQATAQRDLRANEAERKSSASATFKSPPGQAEIEPDVRSWLAGFYAALSADTMPPAGAPDPHFASKAGRLRDRFPAGLLPTWLSSLPA